MSGPPAMFPCPWCGLSYPAKPVLIGKPVRCKGCRNAFVLQPDWVAIKVEDPPAAAPPPPAPAPPPAPPPAPAPRPAAPPAPAHAAAPKPPPRIPQATIEPISVVAPAPAPPKPARPAATVPEVDLDLDGGASEDVVQVLPQAKTQTPPPQKGSERLPKRKTEQLEAARAQMAAQLAEVAAKAANSEVAKREERKSERIAKAGTAVPSGGKAHRKAVLSGQGEQHHRELLRLWSIIGIAAAVIVLLVFVFSLRSSVRESLDAYAAPVPNEQNRYPVLGDAVRARAWLASAPSMPAGPLLATDLSDASIAAERTLDLEPIRPLLADLKDLRLDSGMGLWLAPKDAERARGAIGERRGADAVQALAAARIRCVPQRTVDERMNLPPEDAAIVLDLLLGTPSPNGEPFAKRMLDKGEVPARLILRSFRGGKGSLLQDIGRPPYKPVQAPYSGTLMRIEGDGWAPGWRVLYLALVK